MPRRPRWRHRRVAAAALVAIALLVGCSTEQGGSPTASGSDGELLTVAEERDGDSFVASDGVEYRIGMINTPERSECGGHDAAARAYDLLADGFTADAYASDTHGRRVARIRAGDIDVGITLAEEGWADDRYLEQFRHEHPAYAVELERAFADARAEQSGLWRTCWAASATTSPVAPPVPPPPVRSGDGEAAHRGRTGTWTCHAAYAECLPDGPDLDCRDVGHQVRLLGQDDPYRLDGNSTTATDGVGCDSFPPWDPATTYPYHTG